MLLAGVWAWLCYCNVQGMLSVNVRLSRQTTSMNCVIGELFQYYLAWFINVSLLDVLANWGTISHPLSHLSVA